MSDPVRVTATGYDGTPVMLHPSHDYGALFCRACGVFGFDDPRLRRRCKPDRTVAPDSREGRDRQIERIAAYLRSNADKTGKIVPELVVGEHGGGRYATPEEMAAAIYALVAIPDSREGGEAGLDVAARLETLLLSVIAMAVTEPERRKGWQAIETPLRKAWLAAKRLPLSEHTRTLAATNPDSSISEGT